jgi:hypothetical protein
MVFLVTVLLGLVLLPARLPARAVAIGAALVAVVLAGAFLPTFSMQILNGVLASAIFIVAVIWGVTAVARLRPRLPRATTGSEPPESPSPPPSAEPPDFTPHTDEPTKTEADQGGPTHA